MHLLEVKHLARFLTHLCNLASAAGLYSDKPSALHGIASGAFVPISRQETVLSFDRSQFVTRLSMNLSELG